MSGFSERPFVAGSVVGLRAFRMTPQQKFLTGPSRTEYLWGPGENIAGCSVGAWVGAPERHRVAMRECRCGFYAYYDGSNDYHRERGSFGSPTVVGVIEGYGTVVTGHRGFRSSKARILGLAHPVPDSIRANYPDVPLYSDVESMLAAHPLTEPGSLGYEKRETWPVHSYGTHINISGTMWAHLQVDLTGVQEAMRKVAEQLAASGLAFKSERLSMWTPESTLRARRSQQRKRPPRKAAPAEVEMLRAQRQEAAERRQQAGLSGVGGIKRGRGRRRHMSQLTCKVRS